MFILLYLMDDIFRNLSNKDGAGNTSKPETKLAQKQKIHTIAKDFDKEAFYEPLAQ